MTDHKILTDKTLLGRALAFVSEYRQTLAAASTALPLAIRAIDKLMADVARADAARATRTPTADEDPKIYLVMVPLGGGPPVPWQAWQKKADAEYSASCQGDAHVRAVDACGTWEEVEDLPDPNYDRWVSEVAKTCRSCPCCQQVPCDGCMAGGICDAQPCREDERHGEDDEEDDEGYEEEDQEGGEEGTRVT